MTSRVVFATSNDNKFREAELILSLYGITLERLPAKGEEIQSDSTPEIAEHAALSIYNKVKRPLLVEDSGIYVKALGGFPGSYSSYVYKTVGLDGMLRLMRGIKDREAKYVSAAVYVDEKGTTHVFVGEAKGVISSSKRGNEGFAYDPIFVPEDWMSTRKTYAQLGTALKSASSHRHQSLSTFAKWYAGAEAPRRP